MYSNSMDLECGLNRTHRSMETYGPSSRTKISDMWLLTNPVGDYAFLNEGDYVRFGAGAFDEIERIEELRSKSFLYEKSQEDWHKAHQRLRFEVKHEYLNHSQLLLMVVPTNWCNSQCVYCQVGSGVAKSNARFMKLSTAEQFCAFVEGLEYDNIKIEFQGGEPTLNMEIVEFIVTRLRLISHKILSFVLCTNLLSIDNRFIRFMRKNSISISTSIDGPMSQHDKQRPSTLARSPFLAVSENIRKLRREAVSVSGLVTVTRQNLEHLRETIDTYVDLGIDSIFIRPLNKYGRAHANQKIAYSDEMFLERYFESVDYIVSLNDSGKAISEVFFSILLKKILTPYDDGYVDLQDPCAYGIECLIVNHGGELYPSDEARMLSEMGDEKWKIGNIIDPKIFQRLGEFQAFAPNETLNKYSTCIGCAFRPYCGADFVRKSRTTPDTYCGNRFGMFSGVFERIRRATPQQMGLFLKWATT